MGSRLLSKEAHDSHAAHTAPHPQASNVGMLLMMKMAKILVKSRPFFTQREGEAGMKIIIWRHSVSDGVGFRQKNVTGYFVDHGGCLDGGGIAGGISGIISSQPPRGARRVDYESLRESWRHALWRFDAGAGVALMANAQPYRFVFMANPRRVRH